MRLLAAFASVLAALLLTGLAHAQGPQLIDYQGRVAVRGVNFEGAGRFKFAIVDATGATTYWSNDGTSAAGSEPAAAIALPVSEGRYSVLLGDATLANMTAVPAAVFTRADLRLRVWFGDGKNGSQLLTPDQRIASGGSATVPGGEPVASGAPPPPAVSPSYVRIGTAATGDIWQQRAGSGTLPAVRYFHTAVWTGSEMIVWGGTNTVSLNDGARYDPAGNNWTALSLTGAPSARFRQTAVWTGGEMIIWGGINGGFILNDGARYNPAANTWTAVASAGVSFQRFGHTAVWTGSEMVVWGGFGGPGPYRNDGGRYDPAGNSWTAVAATGAPAARYDHTAIWTGSEMIVWGGYNGSDLSDGARYNPAGNSWTALNAIGPNARRFHTAVWTGSEMIVWGGFIGTNTALNDGGRYNPAGDSWTPVSLTAAPVARYFHTAIWTGSEMIVWGGQGGPFLNDGGRFNPATSSWSAVSTVGAPSVRRSATAVWTGSEMIIWGGYGASSLNDGGRYNPTGNSWTGTSPSSPTPRYRHTSVWTGSEMILWGGWDGTSELNNGGRFNPAANTWTAMSTSGAPVGRELHTAVWTGSEMIVWGGLYYNGSTNYLGDGGRYNPAGNSWTAVSNTGAPAARWAHTAVWTGSEMIVWGGGTPVSANTGGRYNPTGNNWTAVSITGAPSARALHTAVWTGADMIVWGGIGLNDGGRYDPAGNSWTPVSTVGAPAGRERHTVVWTGSEMIVWGGAYYNASYHFLNDGGVYNSAGNSWRAVSTTGAPLERWEHTAVWTGVEMIVWGGFYSDGSSHYLNDGGRYNPAGNSWTTVSATGAPGARLQHTAVWTGSEMIVRGGTNGQSFLGDTWSYRPPSVQATLTFGPLVPSFTYTVQRSSSLLPANWQPLVGATQSDSGSERTVVDPAVFDPNAFYRILTTSP